MSNAEKIEAVRAEWKAAVQTIGDRINARISERRAAAGCASTVATSQNWRESDWAEFNAELRPYFAKVRTIGGSLL